MVEITMGDAAMSAFPSVAISVPNATPEELTRGLAAALAVFGKAGITPWKAAAGIRQLEAWDASGLIEELEPSDEDCWVASVWDRAEEAACDAVCMNWDARRHRPVSARMELSGCGA